MPISASNYDGTQSYNVAEMGDLCKPNILVNSDFKSGVINQKGQTSYTKVNKDLMTTIDMWKMLSKDTDITLKVNDGYITLSCTENTDKGQGIYQTFKPLVGKYTMYVKVKSKTCSAKMVVGGKTQSLNVGENFMTVDVSSGFTGVWIMLVSAGSVDIEQIKLEEGYLFTGMKYWDYSDELLKCKRYLEILKNESIMSNAFVNKTIYFKQKINEMSKIPTVTIKGDASKISVYANKNYVKIGSLNDLSHRFNTKNDFVEIIVEVPTLQSEIENTPYFTLETGEAMLIVDSNDY